MHRKHSRSHLDQRSSPSLPHPPAVFSPREQHDPAMLLRILLIMAGIEQNPGPPPIWICSICQNNIHKNTTSVKCNGCYNWCHLRSCSGLQHHRHWNQHFLAQCCTTTRTPYVSTQPTPRTQHPLAVPPLLPPTSTPSPTSLNILQLNCNGLRSKLDEIVHFMEKNDVLIATIQETKLNLNVNVSLPNYTIVRRDRVTDQGGGLAFIVHKTVNFRTISLPDIPTDNLLEQMAISITSGDSEIQLVNVYIPPSSSCPSGYSASIEHLLRTNDSLLMGDLNAHHSSWHSAKSDDARGNIFAAQIDQSQYGILNDTSATRITPNCTSSPDVTLASASLLTCTEWGTIKALSSDHVPIIIRVQRTITKQNSERRTFINFAKADWEGFKQHIEEEFDRKQLPNSAHLGEKIFNKTLRKAARIFIPAGRIPEIRPNFPTSAARLADERDNLRANDPSNPRIPEMSFEIKKMVNEHKRNQWRSHLEKCSFVPGTKNLWQTIKRLSNTQVKADNTIISFEGIPIPDQKKCANEFNRQFTPHPLAADKKIRSTMRKIHQLNVNTDISFSAEQLTMALKSTKNSKALGPDGISPMMLKHLGPLGITFLTRLMNLSLLKQEIPGVWKIGRVIPLLKPNKPVDQAKSFRPISLLSPSAKLFESLLLPILKTHLPLAEHQHGFRIGYSTTTALHVITNHILRGLNRRRPNHRTVMVALDLSRAFDTVSHSVLLQDLLTSTLPSTVKRWLASYLRGRQTYVEFRDTKSKHRKMKQGVPQGGILSPILFNYYLSCMPDPPNGITLVSYADDCTLLCTHPDIQTACELLNTYLTQLHGWLQSRQLELSAEKSTATLFTTWNREIDTVLNIHVAGNAIPTVAQPRILGVILDNMLTFGAHAKQVHSKLQSRNNVLKSLAGSTWGKDKETIVTTYKAIGRSIINYAAPIWTPQLSQTSWNKLQTTQNAALRTATGSHLMAHHDHLHTETKLIPVKTHNTLLSRQYLLRCHLEEHPCNRIIHDEPQPRCVRKGLVSSYKSDLTDRIPTTGLDVRSYKEGVAKLHRETVEETIMQYIPNVVINKPAPQIDTSENILPRSTRATLSQLRSGWCRLLNCYMSRLDNTIDNACPLCGSGPHDTRHLFNCKRNKTKLSVMSLWTKPVEAAAFLGLKIQADEDES